MTYNITIRSQLNTDVMLKYTDSLPVHFTTINGLSASIRACVAHGMRDHFIGTLLDEDNDLVPFAWDQFGNALKPYGSSYSSDYQLVDKNAANQALFDRLTSTDQNIVVAIYKATEGKKISGIKAIRAVTGWGLVEAKVAYQVTIPLFISKQSSQLNLDDIPRDDISNLGRHFMNRD